MDNKLLKKLHVKPGFKLLIENAPENVAALLGDFDAVQLSFNATQGFDALLLFVVNSYELKEQLSLIASSLKPDTLFWIAYPKKTSGMESDLHMMAPWDEVKAHQLTPCASISISEVWTGIRLKPIDLVKASAVRNENIQQNDFSKYVDVVNKKVFPPSDLDQALHEQPLALAYFESLAYSHKKEYVLWILTAKQEKTRLGRIEKMIQMLLAKRKNPNDK